MVIDAIHAHNALLPSCRQRMDDFGEARTLGSRLLTASQIEIYKICETWNQDAKLWYT